MSYTLIRTNKFAKRAKRFLQQNRQLAGEFLSVLEQLETDPKHPSLRLHALKGKLEGKHAVSLTYSHRIVLILALSEGEIILLDLGTHDQVYRD